MKQRPCMSFLFNYGTGVAQFPNGIFPTGHLPDITWLGLAFDYTFLTDCHVG